METAAISGPRRSKLLSRLFWTVLVLLVLLSGLLKTLSEDRYRVAFVAPLVLVTLALQGRVRILQTTMLWVALLCLIFVSSWANNQPTTSALFVARSVLIGFAFEQLAHSAVPALRLDRLIRSLLWLGALQLPVVLLQYSLAYAGIYQRDLWHDSFYGTFGTTDYQLAFFLNGLIILLLFSRHVRRAAGRLRWPLIGLYLAILLLTNSRVNQVYVILVVSAYLLTRLRPQAIIISLFLGGALALTNQVWGEAFDRLRLSSLLAYFEPIPDRTWDLFYQGRNQRRAAIAYLYSRGLSWLGDGPGAYFRFRGGYRYGIVGAMPLYYAELGLVAVTLAVTIAWLISRPVRLTSHGSFRVNPSSLMLLGLFLALSLIKDPFSDGVVMFLYCTFVALARSPLRPRTLVPLMA